MSKKYLTDEEELGYFNSEKFKQDVKEITHKSGLKLANQCMMHRYLYYVVNRPILTDVEYDILEKQAILSLEINHPNHPIFKPGSSKEIDYHPLIIKQALELLTKISI